MNKLSLVNTQVYLGSDPEAFFERDGQIIGSEKVIPMKWETGVHPYMEQVARDGIQVELHPAPLTLGGAVPELRNLLAKFFKYVDTVTPKTTVSFKELVEVSREELDSVSPESRMLGCQPSKNQYELPKAKVDGNRYRKRSAGGHIHLGLLGTGLMAQKDYRERLPMILDWVVGNTGVLLDRDTGQVERRRVYGQAGEYRLQKYGLEYRTLSNFWLRSPVLTELMYGLALLSADILIKTVTTKQDYELELLGKVNYKQAIRSIQMNDLKFALENWTHVKSFLLEHVTAVGYLNASLVSGFEKFVGIVNNEGLDKFFPADYESVKKAWAGKSPSLSDFLQSI